MNSDVWFHADRLAGALAQLLRSPSDVMNDAFSYQLLQVENADMTYARDVLAEYREGMHHRRCSQCAYVVTMTDDNLAAGAMTEHVAKRHPHG